MELQNELLSLARYKFPLSQEVCAAFQALPRHKFLTRFSADYFNWLKVSPETMPLIYEDSTLLLYSKNGYTSTISQPSFVLEMLDLLDLHPGMRVFELGAGSGWNAALMGYLVGKKGLVKSYEIIPEMAKAAQENVAQFDLPQVEIIPGDALMEMWDEDEFDRGIFTAGARDMPGSLFDLIRNGGKLIFVLQTTRGDLLLAMEKEPTHFRVFKKLYCQFVSVTGPVLDSYHNDLSEILQKDGEITIWPQGTLDLGPNVLAGRDMVFRWG